MQNDFRNFAVNHLGMSSNALDGYSRYLDKVAGNVTSTAPSADYMNPYILEERQLNVTQMDVFSRLMMDRIIFLGTQVTDTSANIIQAQLLYLDSIDPEKDISIYINSPGGSMQDWASTIRCNTSPAMSQRYAREWQPQWPPCFSWPVRLGSATLFHIQGS